MDMLWVYLVFYVVVYAYGFWAILAGLDGLARLTAGDGRPAIRRFAVQFATLPLSVCLFGALVLDVLLERGLVPDISAASPHFLRTFAYCVYRFVDAVALGALSAFGLEPPLGIHATPSMALGSLLLFSLSAFGSVAAFRIVVLAIQLNALAHSRLQAQ